MRLLPDTNVLVYETVEDSEHHAEATRVLDRAKEIYLLPIVVHEYMWVMLRLVGAPSGFVAAKLKEYMEDPRTRYILEPPEVLQDALGMLEEDGENPREVNDYIILAGAIRLGAALATFDRRLRRRAVRRGLVTLP